MHRELRAELHAPAAAVTIRAVTFDAYGTLFRNEGLNLIPQAIVTDHGLSTPVDDILQMWLGLYYEATQTSPFRTLREIQLATLAGVLRQLGVTAAAAPYVDLFFQVTTKVELYAETVEVLEALRHVGSAVVSNADHEHLAAWGVTLPVQFILVSETMRAYKPAPVVFETALRRLGVRPDETLHVGDSEVDDVMGAKAAGLRVAWLNRAGRPRRRGTPPPDFEIHDLGEVLCLV